VLPQFTGKVTQTMNAHFMWDEGFKSDGWLTGDGVCHLASLIYRAAKDAGLETLAPTNHNFADIPEVPKEYGVSIFARNPQQNLYITNTFDKPVQFAFTYDGTNLTVKVID
jgi:vancomycin resistance protein YoaR